MNGFYYDFDLNESLLIEFDVKVKEDVNVEKLWNIAYANEESSEVSIDVEIIDGVERERLPETGLSSFYPVSLNMLFGGLILVGTSSKKKKYKR